MAGQCKAHIYRDFKQQVSRAVERLLAFPVLYTSGLLLKDCPRELSNRRALRLDAEIPKILSRAAQSRFRADALMDGQPSL